MINHDKWIGSLPKSSLNSSSDNNQIEQEKWINTIHKKNNNNSLPKYSIVAILFLSGLLFVSALKNETRILQKNINNLQASINVIKFNLNQAILDNEILTSPENVSFLAKEYLNINLTSYKRSQIKELKSESIIKSVSASNKNFSDVNKTKKLPDEINSKIAKKIKQKKTEIKKLQELYRNPKLIPSEVRAKVKKSIQKKKSELDSIYKEPKNILTLERVGKWSAIQVVKLFLGIPVIPGK